MAKNDPIVLPEEFGPSGIDGRTTMFLFPYVCTIREMLRPSARMDFITHLRKIKSKEEALEVLNFIDSAVRAERDVKLRKDSRGAKFIIQSSALSSIFRKPHRAFRKRFRILFKVQ